ncbi:acyltransferase family protein [Amycolatopsis cihanbeyliensis]|uniref:Peptidoglycan/LPS O-acetylase OafA/YrhL n=1 Tax=Amycolatopsis cihanbeyliensis TaxID=1128664 RepID=A0A542CSX4_AMYCI|nr:peptidoglycan/LPS O-acetylase OafA/YrhL [Amycolatopsis cihanbeyliensis]
MAAIPELAAPEVRAENASKVSARYLSWDAIRVLGIGAVLAFHATFLAPVNLSGLDPLPAPLRMDFPFGAAVLIVVSGYFAAMTIGRQTPVRWWVRRIARLLPAFLVAVLAIFAVTRLLAPADYPQPGLGDLIGNLTLMHLWIPEVRYIDLAHWTVPVQVGAFTAIAVLAFRGRLRGKAATGVLWAVLLVPLAVRGLAMAPGDTPPQWLSVVLDGSGLNRSHLVIAGVIIYRWSKGRMSFGQLFAMLCVILVAHAWHPPNGDSVQAFTLGLVLICVAAYRPAWELPWLDRFARPLRWLAGISYGVYLMHYTVGTILALRLAELGLRWWVWVPAFTGCAVLLGWALTAWVERPAYRLLTRRLATPS